MRSVRELVLIACGVLVGGVAVFLIMAIASSSWSSAGKQTLQNISSTGETDLLCFGDRRRPNGSVPPEPTFRVDATASSNFVTAS